eukprot:13525625-Alexandrium_andersonii.AAC.1
MSGGSSAETSIADRDRVGGGICSGGTWAGGCPELVAAASDGGTSSGAAAFVGVSCMSAAASASGGERT